jgi:predicted XRE-type DNA-binding protein
MDRLPRRGTASSLSRIRAATLRPVVRASCLNRRSVVSGSFTVIPFIITYHGNPILTEWQYRAAGAAGARLKRAEEEHIRARPLTQTRAAHILRIDQPKISRLLRGQLSGFSTGRLMHFLTLLDRDVEITVKPAPRSRRQGHLRVVATGWLLSLTETNPAMPGGSRRCEVLGLLLPLSPQFVRVRDGLDHFKSDSRRSNDHTAITSIRAVKVR